MRWLLCETTTFFSYLPLSPPCHQKFNMTLYETAYKTAYVYQCTCSKENSKKEINVAMKERVWNHAWCGMTTVGSISR
jgi:predicted SprT family Zn-dependent metalloprotease